MKISNKTLSLLQSFAQISSNLLVKPGKKVATRNAVNSVQARAVVDETFAQQFAIYDLNQLLSLISASHNPDIEFGDKSLIIRSENGGEVEYFYADESLVTSPNEVPPQLEDIYSFKMTASDIQTIVKTAGIISATTMNIVSEKGKVVLTINDPKNSTSHSYKKSLGDSDKAFNVKMAIDSFKVVADEYNVRVANAIAKTSKVLVFFFESTTSDLTYLIAADSTSKV
jgi:hypothetical protein